VGARFSAPVQTCPGAHLASCTMGTGSFQGQRVAGRDADPSPLLVPWSRKSRAIPLLPLWVYGSYSLCRAPVLVQGCILPTFYMQIEVFTFYFVYFLESVLYSSIILILNSDKYVIALCFCAGIPRYK